MLLSSSTSAFKLVFISFSCLDISLNFSSYLLAFYQFFVDQFIIFWSSLIVYSKPCFCIYVFFVSYNLFQTACMYFLSSSFSFLNFYSFFSFLFIAESSFIVIYTFLSFLFSSPFSYFSYFSTSSLSSLVWIILTSSQEGFVYYSLVYILLFYDISEFILNINNIFG